MDEMHLARVAISSFSYRFFKRFVDSVVACFLLISLAPLFLATALAVRMSSSGPIVYRERRIGRLGKEFTIYKFRSMYTTKYLATALNYSECEKTQMKKRQEGKHIHDPRITRSGSFLRRFSLDELPQLVNVLKGDMSLVGPRPVVAQELLRYGRYGTVLPVDVSGTYRSLAGVGP